MGLSCSTSKISTATTISVVEEIDGNPLIDVAERFNGTIEQIGSMEIIPDSLRMELNKLILSRSKLIHCLVRISKSDEETALWDDLRNELKVAAENTKNAIKQERFSEFYPILSMALQEQLNDLLRVSKVKSLVRTHSNIDWKVRRITVRTYTNK